MVWLNKEAFRGLEKNTFAGLHYSCFMFYLPFQVFFAPPYYPFLQYLPKESRTLISLDHSAYFHTYQSHKDMTNEVLHSFL